MKWLWLAWVLTGATIEGYALATNYRNTLSEITWGLEGTGWTFFRYFVAVFTFWLFVHLTFKVLK
jgi:hypothetical protein